MRQLGQRGEHGHLVIRVQPSCRLVEDQHFGLGADCTGDGHQTLLHQRQRADGHAAGGLGEADLGQQFAGDHRLGLQEVAVGRIHGVQHVLFGVEIRLHGVQLRYDAQTVAAQFHGLELNNVGALVHHRARHRRGQTAHHAHQRATFGVGGDARIGVVADQQRVCVSGVAEEIRAIEDVDLALGTGDRHLVQGKGRVGLEQNVVGTAAHQHAIDTRGQRHGGIGRFALRLRMLGQCVFVIGFGQSECFVDAGGIALGHFGGCVGRSDGVCFGLAGLVGCSGFGRCQCAVNTIVNSAFVINVIEGHAELHGASWNGFNGVVRLSLRSHFVSRCVSGLLEFLIVVLVSHACASASSVVVVVLLASPAS